MHFSLGVLLVVGFGAQSSVVLTSITIEMLLKCLKKGNIDSGRMQKGFHAFPAS